MYKNADEFPDGEILRGFDVCIIGGGAAGIAMATRLIGSRLKVLVLESGVSIDRGTPSGNREAIYRGSTGPFMSRVNPNFLTSSRQRMYGGTTNHFGFWARPLDEADLRPRPGYRDAYWPLTLEELNPYYLAANAYGDYGPNNYDDLEFWEEVLHARPLPAEPDDRLRNVIFHAQYNEAIKNFQLRWGTALQSANNVFVLFNANVLTIDSTAGRNHVVGLALATIDAQGRAGKRLRVEGARTYVLAQGGIESVRLLKLSGNLGDNARGHLGRGFMVHPVIEQAATVRFASPVPYDVQNFYRSQQVYLQEPGAMNGREAVRSTPVYHPETLAEMLVFSAWGVLTPTPAAMAAERIGNFRIIPGFSGGGTAATLNINWEQAPNENSRIDLDPGRTDPVFGQPVVRVDWNLEEKDKRTIVQGLKLCEEFFRRRPPYATSFEITTDLSGGPENWTFGHDQGNRRALWPGDHHMGTLRMSASDRPEDGIVNPNLRMHAVDNLFVSSCAVFPTSGYANPTLTIVALALRLADYLKGNLD